MQYPQLRYINSIKCNLKMCKSYNFALIMLIVIDFTLVLAHFDEKVLCLLRFNGIFKLFSKIQLSVLWILQHFRHIVLPLEDKIPQIKIHGSKSPA